MDQELKMEETTLTMMPSCCGKKMGIKSRTIKFLEVWCSVCEDVAYVKNRILN